MHVSNFAPLFESRILSCSNNYNDKKGELD